VANANVIPANGSGSFDVYVTDNAWVIIDINGYYLSPNSLMLGAGTAAAPSLTFGTDGASGLYSSGAGAVSVAAGGTNKLTVTSIGVGIGTKPSYALDVAGDVNFSGALRYNSSIALQFFNGGDTTPQNTSLGFGAMTNGFRSTAVGAGALQQNIGIVNTAVGTNALAANISGNSNTALGYGTLTNNTTANGNTGAGFEALFQNTTGASNTAIGTWALSGNSTGSNNTAIGSGAAGFPVGGYTTGSNNIAIGSNAAVNVPGTNSNNIHIGTRGSANDSGAIRIGGNTVFNDTAAQTSFYAAGINGVQTGINNAVPVLIDGNGQLGTMNSSRRFKEDIQDMGNASSGLMKLRPVTFRYKKPFADGAKPIQFGLIAEEVEEVYPDLVAKAAHGQVESVKYQILDSMLLNEVQKQHRTIDSQNEKLKAQEEDLNAQRDLLKAQTEAIRRLESRLAELENRDK
jgi:polyhydroxyalkanoate synthesis regulator phasin